MVQGVNVPKFASAAESLANITGVSFTNNIGLNLVDMEGDNVMISEDNDIEVSIQKSDSTLIEVGRLKRGVRSSQIIDLQEGDEITVIVTDKGEEYKTKEFIYEGDPTFTLEGTTFVETVRFSNGEQRFHDKDARWGYHISCIMGGVPMIWWRCDINSLNIYLSGEGTGFEMIANGLSGSAGVDTDWLNSNPENTHLHGTIWSVYKGEIQLWNDNGARVINAKVEGGASGCEVTGHLYRK